MCLTHLHDRIAITLHTISQQDRQHPESKNQLSDYVVGMGLQWSDTVDPASYRSLYLLPGYLEQAQLTKHLQLVGQCP